MDATPDGDETGGMDAPVPRVGAPLIEAFLPPADPVGAELLGWLQSQAGRVQRWLDSVTQRWRPLGSFVEVNYLHPELGRSGAVVMTSPLGHLRRYRTRIARLMVIPHSEVAPYLARWEAGETVVVAVAEMPEPLALRYANTPVQWSLNVPLRPTGTWVGLVGAVTAETVSKEMVAAYRALADLIEREVAAVAAWNSFRSTLDDKRFLRPLPGEVDERGSG